MLIKLHNHFVQVNTQIRPFVQQQENPTTLIIFKFQIQATFGFLHSSNDLCLKYLQINVDTRAYNCTCRHIYAFEYVNI